MVLLMSNKRADVVKYGGGEEEEEARGAKMETAAVTGTLVPAPTEGERACEGI